MAEQGTQDFYEISLSLARGIKTYSELIERSKALSEKSQYSLEHYIKRAVDEFSFDVFDQKSPEEKNSIRNFRKDYQVTEWIRSDTGGLCPRTLSGIRVHVLDQLHKDKELGREEVATIAAQATTFLSHVERFHDSPQ